MPYRKDPTGSRALAGSIAPRLLPALVVTAIVAVIAGMTYFTSSGRRDAPAVPDVAGTSNAGASNPLPGQARIQPQVQESSGINGAGPASRMQALERASAKELARHHTYARRFSAERVDAPWAGAHQSRMVAASRSDQIAQLHAEPDALDIDCKATMCRVVADFATRTASEDWFTLFSIGGSDIPNATYEHSFRPDGTVRLTVYGLMRN